MRCAALCDRRLSALIPAFTEIPAERTGAQLLRCIGWTLAAVAVALLGALVVVGVMSSPLAMEEIERFRGVKLVLALPPLIALCVYFFDRRFGSGVERPRDVFLSPMLAYQLLAGIAIVAAGARARDAKRERQRYIAVGGSN